MIKKSPGLKFLRDYRLSHNLTMANMAKGMAISAQTYHYLETKAFDCSVKTLLKFQRMAEMNWIDLGRIITEGHKS